MKALMLIMLLWLSPALASKPVQLCQDNVDVYPWRMTAGNGLHNIMLAQVAQRIHIPVETQSIPWSHCLDMVRKGQIDGAIAASFAREYLAFGAYPLIANKKPDKYRRMSDESYALYILDGNPEAVHWDGNALLLPTGKPVAIQRGSSAAPLLRYMTVELDEGDSKPEFILHKVLSRNAAAAVLNTLDGTYLLKNPVFSGKFTRLDPPLSSREAYLLFSRRFTQERPGLADRIWDEIAKVRESVDYQARLFKMLYSPQ